MKLRTSEFMFSFPIRLRSQAQIDEAEKMSDLLNQDVEIDYVLGTVVIPIEEIIGWQDSFSRDLDIEDVKKYGCDLTIIETQSLDAFVCTWPREKFEEEYNNHLKFLEDFVNEDDEKDDDETITIAMEEYIYLLDLEKKAMLPKWKQILNIITKQ